LLRAPPFSSLPIGERTRSCDDETVDESVNVERILSVVQEKLPLSARPWRIDAKRDEQFSNWSIRMEHEASHGVGIDVPIGNADVMGCVSSWLATVEPELLRVAVAPPLEHPDAVLEIRALTHAFNWTRTEVGAVVRMVQPSMFNDQEASWLMETTGRDAPAPNPSTEI
jgi:hypothetical protein